MKKIDMSRMSERERAGAHQEVRLLSALEHPHVIQFFDSFIHKGFMCIVTEYCEAGDLYRLLKQQNMHLPEEQVRETTRTPSQIMFNDPLCRPPRMLEY